MDMPIRSEESGGGSRNGWNTRPLIWLAPVVDDPNSQRPAAPSRLGDEREPVRGDEAVDGFHRVLLTSKHGWCEWNLPGNAPVVRIPLVYHELRQCCRSKGSPAGQFSCILEFREDTNVRIPAGNDEVGFRRSCHRSNPLTERCRLRIWGQGMHPSAQQRRRITRVHVRPDQLNLRTPPRERIVNAAGHKAAGTSKKYSHAVRSQSGF